ncbi:tetratricopeptide repeat protein [Winogradskyella sp. UBA3174]|uniref:tetratricopeptide repeat protein n=1 Tax=Winogradskyella sp. UBA3174 TaxID=1947785 RepID=UPI0025F50AFD|nr:hypothetical protein [Winogradskyella sp. UBA3174]|tara:strand:- start:3671 stop:4873 length:1203 start_codon:yes stop_codon:yes gene_type:complete
MKIKSSILIFTTFISALCYAQEEAKVCSCLLLPETEENDEKVEELARNLETSFNDLETTVFNQKFDVEGFMSNVVDNDKIDKNDEFTRGFMKGVKQSGFNLSAKIVDEIDAGSYYNLINYHYDSDEKAYYFTFRIYSSETGVNYHDYKVCFDGETTKFNDIYIYLTGEKLSATLQRIFILSQPSKNVLSKLLGGKSDNSILKIAEAKKLLENGKPKKAYKKISEVEGPMAKEKFTLIIKGSIASAFDDELYGSILEEFAELYPDDPTLYLKQVDYYILKEDYKKAIENIEILMYETDDDFLNLVKANAYLMDKDYKNAEKYYVYMTVNYPDLFEAYVGLMVSLNYQSSFKETLNIVKDLLNQGYDREALLEFLEEKEADGSNELEAFVTSKVYKQWKRKS